MVMKPQRRVSFKLLNVFFICLPRGAAADDERPLVAVVGNGVTAATVEERFKAVNGSWPILWVFKCLIGE